MDRRNLIKRGAGAIAVAGLGPSLQKPQEIEAAPKHVALLVLDRSGSMNHLRQAVVDGVNTFLDEQARTEMHIGIVQFDSLPTAEGGFCEWIFPFTPASQTPRLTLGQYQPRGGTPLYEAVAESISKLEQVIRPQDRALLVFQTDGKHEHPKSEITREVVVNLKKAKEDLGNWTWAFMGASMDAWDSSVQLAYTPSTTLSYTNSVAGTNAAWRTTAGSTNAWYTTTGGGITSADKLLVIPANTNTQFYTINTTDNVLKEIDPDSSTA